MVGFFFFFFVFELEGSSVVRAFDHGAMGRQIDSPWGGPIELFLIPASGFPLSLSEWSFTICLMPHNRK